MAGAVAEDSRLKGQPDIYVSSTTDDDGTSRDQMDMARLGKKQELNVKKDAPFSPRNAARK